MKFIFSFLVFVSTAVKGQVKSQSSHRSDTIIKKVVDSDIQQKNQIPNPVDTIVKTLKENEQLRLVARVDSTMIYMVKTEEKNEVFPTYIFPLLTLIIGALIPALWEFFRSRTASNKVGRRWLTQIRSFSKIVDRQEANFTELINNERNGEYGIANLTIFASLNAEDFQTLNKDELMTYLISSKNMKMEEAISVSMKLLAEINIVKNLYENTISNYELYKSNFSTYIMKVNSHLHDIGVLLGKLQTEFEGRQDLTQEEFNTITDAFELFFEKLVSKPQAEMSNLFKLEVEFFNPLINLLTPLRKHETVLNILNIIASCKHSIRGIREEKKDIAKITEKIKEKFQEASRSLNELADEIEHRQKPKGWFNAKNNSGIA